MLRDKNAIENFSANLREIMKQWKCSQKQLEAESGVSQAAISRMLNGKGDPPLTSALCIARSLITSVDALCGPPMTPKRKILQKSARPLLFVSRARDGGLAVAPIPRRRSP